MLRFLPLRILGITVAFWSGTSISPWLALPAAAQDSGCFMVSTTGRTLDLSRLCGGTGPKKPETTPASTPTLETTVPTAITLPGNSRVFLVKIKRRDAGTPVIDVTFNGRKPFEMVVDTGASNTVITSEMAQVLGVRPMAVQRFDTANAQGIQLGVGQVALVSVGGVVAKNLTVAIAGPDLPVGLLGHDFFGDYDMTVKRDVIEFRTREPAPTTEVGGLGP